VTLLLDTHVLIWLAENNARLRPRARTALLTGSATVSAISVWEIGIKSASGRLRTPAIEQLLDGDEFPELPFTSQHAREAGNLPLHHRDPFDRALVAQARVEGLVLVTADRRLEAYDVALLDASR
jgi:PIN domain nuclease of toxin-antitoxin system